MLHFPAKVGQWFSFHKFFDGTIASLSKPKTPLVTTHTSASRTLCRKSVCSFHIIEALQQSSRIWRIGGSFLQLIPENKQINISSLYIQADSTHLLRYLFAQAQALFIGTSTPQTCSCWPKTPLCWLVILELHENSCNSLLHQKTW